LWVVVVTAVQQLLVVLLVVEAVAVEAVRLFMLDQ
jgi:hypothetical protein